MISCALLCWALLFDMILVPLFQMSSLSESEMCWTSQFSNLVSFGSYQVFLKVKFFSENDDSLKLKTTFVDCGCAALSAYEEAISSFADFFFFWLKDDRTDPREMIWSYTLGRFTKDFLAAVASMSRRDSLSSRSSHLIDWKTKNLNSVFHYWESSRQHPRYDWFLRARASTTPHIFRIPPKVTRPRNLIIKSSARGRKDSKINELREEKRDDTTKVFLQYIFIAIAAEEFANVNKFCQ